MRRLAVLVAAALVVVLVGPAAAGWAAASPVSYVPPVDAPIADGFRPPVERWGAGNRGVDYGTQPGADVGAAADGEVVFAGQVGGGQHVVVLHGDGVRTSYSFLRTIGVRRGDHVRQGQPVGTSGDSLHFGARVGEAYVDPTLLFGDGLPQVHLVPDGDVRPGTEAEERAGLWRQLAHALGDAGRWVGDQIPGYLEEARGLGHYATEGFAVVHVVRIAGAARDWARQLHHCTPATVVLPELDQRHIAVLVAGLGSSAEHGAIDDVDTAALGFADTDVVRFSYNGGSVEKIGDAVVANDYGPRDTTDDIRASAQRLHDLLAATAAANPGVPIDILGHSEGGLVARTALAYEDPEHPVPEVASLVTLATMHQGADMATAGFMIGRGLAGDLVEKGISQVTPWDLQGTSVGQMSETSSLMAGLDGKPLPERVDVTSIGARWDIAVVADRTELAGAEHVVVSPPGLWDHGSLPGSPQAQREIALAIRGMPPTCQSFGDAMIDAVVSEGIGQAEDSLGGAAWIVSRRYSPTSIGRKVLGRT